MVMQVTIPESKFPEYRLTVTWRADADGNGIRCFLEHCVPGREPEALQTSFHPELNIIYAVESALTQFFEGGEA
jgi:hypothetical protein